MPYLSLSPMLCPQSSEPTFSIPKSQKLSPIGFKVLEVPPSRAEVTHLTSVALYRPSIREGQVEEGVSVAAPRGDMDGSRIRVTDISESYRRQKVFLRWVSEPLERWGFSSHTPTQP